MFVGGMAVNYYGFPRATFDVDVALVLKEENIKNFVNALKKEEFIAHVREVHLIQKLGNQFFVSVPSSPYRVDIFLAKKDFERHILKRRKKRKLFGKETFLISAEDLILTKITLSRPRDYEDAVGVFERQKGKLNRRYLERYAAALGVSKKLKDLMKVDLEIINRKATTLNKEALDALSYQTKLEA